MSTEVRSIHEALDWLVGDGAPPGWAERMARYVELLRERNRRVNLVSRKSVDRVVSEQILPSLAALRVVPAGADLRVLDVGSGGGLPGIPLGIVRPEARIDLVEATRKKAEFLEEAVRVAGLRDPRVHGCRIEQPSPELLSRAPFDVALARAVGDQRRLSRAVRPLLSAGGALWTFVAPGTEGSLPWPEQGEPRSALLRSSDPGSARSSDPH